MGLEFFPVLSGRFSILCTHNFSLFPIRWRADTNTSRFVNIELTAFSICISFFVLNFGTLIWV